MFAYYVIFNRSFPAHNAIFFSVRFIFTLVTIPVTVGNAVHFRFKAIHVVTSITTIAQQEFVFVVSTLTKLTILKMGACKKLSSIISKMMRIRVRVTRGKFYRFHNTFIPSNAGFEHVESHGQLSCRMRFQNCISPYSQT